MRSPVRAGGEPAVFQSRVLGEATLRKIAYYPRLRRVTEHVRLRLAGRVTLQEAAELASMTPTAFSRYFSVKAGISFSTLVKALRIERAMIELESADCAISALAERCGYASFCSFSRAFREITGLTPSEYRRSILE